MISANMISAEERDRIEAAALNAWPAARQTLLDGYVARFSGGYTKRANSVNRVSPPSRTPAELVPLCESLYRAQGLPAIFRVLGDAASVALDDFLQRRGYPASDHTAVMTCALAELADAELARDHRAGASGAALTQFDILDVDAWLDVYTALSGASAAAQAAHTRILHAIAPPRLFAALTLDGEPLACGMGVAENDLFGLFDIVTQPARRRQGFGSLLIRHMATWAQTCGSTTSYLQVVRGNAAALSLYTRLGFQEAYGYWYRIQPPK